MVFGCANCVKRTVLRRKTSRKSSEYILPQSKTGRVEIAIQTRRIFVRWLICSMFQSIASLEGKKVLPFHWLRRHLHYAKLYDKLYR